MSSEPYFVCDGDCAVLGEKMCLAAASSPTRRAAWMLSTP